MYGAYMGIKTDRLNPEGSTKDMGTIQDLMQAIDDGTLAKLPRSKNLQQATRITSRKRKPTTYKRLEGVLNSLGRRSGNRLDLYKPTGIGNFPLPFNCVCAAIYICV